MRAGLRPGMAVLDVGTGTGLVAREAAHAFGRSCRIVGIDPSSKMLREGRQCQAMSVVQGVGERLPFASQSFELVVMGYALRHVSDLDQAFSEYSRVLKPGGRVLLLEITRPESRLGRAFARSYLGSVVPLVARIGTGSTDAARLMRFYWETIQLAVPPETVLASLRGAEFSAVTRRIVCGLFSEYLGTRGGAS
jgi:demethylmenaquinone methyltransferase/2-methoxy-6-polyprenyl-1,4-benzoquinol methylase